jgi:hypothetical protein
MKFLGLIIALVLFVGCQEKKELSVNTIVEKAIAKACSGNCDQAEIDFIFRKKNYKSIRKDGSFQFERTFTDTTGAVRDILTNRGFQRYVNDSLVVLADTTAGNYASSVNSVHYFAQLPYGLQATAVQKELLGEATIHDEPYYEVGVSFQKEGGGTDFEDEFLYWIHKGNFTVDYLAYNYQVEGGGIRFREAYNIRTIEGIRFADYNNYKPQGLGIPLTDLDALFQQGELVLLSKIETENVQVTLLNKE